MYTDNLINKIESYLPNEEVSKIIGAFEFAKDAHEGQKRKSGHDFIVHPCLLYTSPSPRDGLLSRMPSSA